MCFLHCSVWHLVWGISTNAPNEGGPRALHNTEIPFSWLTGFLLSCGHTCLLTSYCKRQRPCKSRLKARGGFCRGWKRTGAQIVTKGLTGEWCMIPCVLMWESVSVYLAACTVQPTVCIVGGSRCACMVVGVCACLSVRLFSPFPQFCSLADCSTPSLVAAPPSSPSLRCWALVRSRETLSHSLVTEQRGWGWTTGDPDMRTCNEVHCHNQELQHPGSATLQLKSDVQPWVIENCWVS